MSKKQQKIFSNQSTEHENSIFSKTGYSNSRLSGQTLGKSQPKLSFDAMTIVGNLNK
ncbi:replication initiation protein, partial [Staphylococcus xylosus]